jgi:hypothetical protein
VAFEEQTRAQGQELETRRRERERTLATLPKNMGAVYNRISARIRDGVAVAEARNILLGLLHGPAPADDGRVRRATKSSSATTATAYSTTPPPTSRRTTATTPPHSPPLEKRTRFTGA